jgi:phage-related protein
LVNITLSLTGSNGDTIVFDNGDYIVETGLKGFGIPNPLVRIDKSADDGGVFRWAKRDIRELDFPVVIIDDNGDLQAKLRRLALILRGAVTIKAEYSTGEKYELIAYFNGGADTVFGDDANGSYCRWVLTLQAPQPYWVSSIPNNFSLSASTGTKGLLATTSLTKLRLKDSSTLGAINVENAGDVPAPVVWTINGPANSVSILNGSTGFVYNGTIASTDVITIDTENGTVKDQNGLNMYANLDASPKLFSIPPGVNSLSITATGSGTGTKITGFFKPRFEVIH